MMGDSAGAAPASAAARDAGVGLAIKRATGTSRPSCRPSSRAARSAIREWPPSMKKSSLRPTALPSRSRDQTALTADSTVPWGASKPAGSSAGSGSAARSSLPLRVTGRASRRITVAGTMLAGRIVRSRATSSGAVGTSAPPTT